MTKFQIWYMKPEWFREGVLGKKPDPANLSATHIHLTDLHLRPGTTLETIFQDMQAEAWSPNGEAQPLIEAMGLEHTSMSVGDVVIDEAGDKYIVASIGFERL